jgi:hypothetical protein
MYIDIIDFLEAAASVVTVVIALLVVFRSLTIGRSLVTQVYRSRAYSLAVLMLIFAAFTSSGVVPGAIGIDISNYGFFVLLLALLVFIDSNVAVAKEIDFFHKDILHWHRTRIPLYALTVAYSAFAVLVIVAQTDSGLSSPLAVEIALVGYFVLLCVVFAYSGVAMFVIARRTYDQTMKKFIEMLGFAVFYYVLFIGIFLPLDAIDPGLGDFVSVFMLIPAAYFFYKAAMSLSFVGRIVKEVA